MLPIAWHFARSGHAWAALLTVLLAATVFMAAVVAWRARLRLNAYVANQLLVLLVGSSIVSVGVLAIRAGLLADGVQIIWAGGLVTCGLFVLFFLKERFSPAPSAQIAKNGEPAGR
jgi:hypothetical protein